ncbi:MAG: beta-ketoacyl-ACP synthase [Synechococcaceae cyanobacterium RL_1_2]|nr:beta-ketoacyl-ACP synthase [Synechococcaceae cyanobacterium RL_1_2]
MDEVVITGIGFFSALGNLAQTWQRMVQGESAIMPRQPFLSLPAYPLAMIEDRPHCLDRLATKIITQALHSSELTPPLPELAIAIGSSRGFQSHWEARISDQTQEGLWLEHLPHHLASLAAQITGATGMVTAMSAACTTGLHTLAYGYDLIKFGHYDRVLVGAVECPVTPLTLATFDQIGALATTGCYPFDRDREGLVLGEGGALFILESLTAAQHRQAPIYGRLLGYGLTCDAYHPTAPEPTGKMARHGIKQCLQRSGLTPSHIDLIHSHGTSTQLNDQLEFNLISDLFPHRPPVIATKGYTGHTLGASGTISVALTLKMMEQKTVIANAGLTNPAFDLNLPMATENQPLHHSLVLGFGFGGQNAAIALGL